MNKKILLSIVIAGTQLINAQNALHFSQSGGRLGDNILSYVKHAWVAYKHNLRLYVPEFAHKEAFALHTHEYDENQLNKSAYQHHVSLNTQSMHTTKDNVLYISGYPTPIDGINKSYNWGDHLFKSMVHDPNFRTYINNMLQCPHNTPDSTLPDMTTVAIHIRKASDRVDDSPLKSIQYRSGPNASDPVNKHTPSRQYSDASFPLKFPPEQYFAEQLEWLYHYLGKQPLYVHIFTNGTDPQAIIQRMKKHIPYANITFRCRNHGNTHDKNIIEDAILISQCDYLIRSQSNFALIPQFMGKHKGIIRPTSWRWENRYLQMTGIYFDQPNYEHNQLESMLIQD